MGMGNTQNRSRMIYRDHDLRVALTYYSAGTRMAAHDHDFHQMTFLLVGSVQETSGGAEADICTAARGLKASGVCHENLFGPSGALMLSINISPGEMDDKALVEGWDWRTGPGVRDAIAAWRPLARFHAARDDREREELAWDIFASMSSSQGVSACVPPGWLRDARDCIVEDAAAPSLSDVARRQGVHPASLSRAFKNAFGEAPSVFRARCRLGRAVARIIRGDPLALAANGAGFADQSHFNRTARRELGITPRQLADVFAAAG